MKIRSFLAEAGARFAYQEQGTSDEYGTIFAGQLQRVVYRERSASDGFAIYRVMTRHSSQQIRGYGAGLIRLGENHVLGAGK